MNNRQKFAVPLFAIQIFLLSCSSKESHPQYTDTPTSGEILIVADEEYQPLIQVQIDTFMEIYKYAKIRAKYLPESKVFEELLNNDSVRLAVVSRPLDKQEQDYFNGRKIIPRVNKIATDAVAFVINKNNPDSLLDYENLRDILQGLKITWKDLNSQVKADTIRVVFDGNGSGNSRYLRETFLENQSFPANCYALGSNASVIDYVNSHQSAIGVIGVNWISDRRDPAVNEFLNKISVIQISTPDTSNASKEYYKPYQAYIALKKYPMTRDVLIISREGRNGLGTGFASFVAGDKGQRIIRLMGMLPATMPVRIIKVN